MEAAPARDLTRQQELLAPPCLDTESFRSVDPRAGAWSPEMPHSQWQVPVVCMPGLSQPSTAFPPREGKGATRVPFASHPGPGPVLGAHGHRDVRHPKYGKKYQEHTVPQTGNFQCCFPGLTPEKTTEAAEPRKGIEKVDPGFKGVTLEFQIQPDSSLQIVPTYSLPGRSCSQKLPASPSKALVSPGGSEALGPRRCASCRTQRTPLWRDAEDGTPLCNACGIRYKKYGTRCSSCWLVPRKSIQPKTLCGRCGVSQDPQLGPTQEL